MPNGTPQVVFPFGEIMLKRESYFFKNKHKQTQWNNILDVLVFFVSLLVYGYFSLLGDILLLAFEEVIFSRNNLQRCETIHIQQ